MINLSAYDLIVIGLVTLGCSIIAYLWADKVLNFLHHRSLGQREEVLRKLDLLFVKVDKARVTAGMLAMSFGVGFLFFLLAWPNIIGGLVLMALFTMIGWSLPLRIVNYLYDKRCNEFVDQMVDAMTIMTNGIRSGLSVTQSMERVAANLPAPISQEFRLVLSEIQIGRSVEEALIDLGERIPRPDVQMFVTSVNILKETGGNMAETFQTIMYTVRERQKIEKKIEALTAQGIFQGVIVTLVPFALLIVLAIADPGYVRPLFTKPLGWFALFCMVGLQLIGGSMIRRIVKIKV
jgi:tight adherence protein B